MRDRQHTPGTHWRKLPPVRKRRCAAHLRQSAFGHRSLSSGRGRSADGIKRVPETGGKIETVAALTPGETAFSDPQVLPDGKWLLFTATSGRDLNRFDRGLIVAESLQT